ncbi:MAG TPA: DUF2934 domain-containing protein [Terriglobia bacterium]|nr:DUF2934 domain-containing protein [Terriglobia bacterium]
MSGSTAKQKNGSRSVAVPISTGGKLGDLAREVQESVGRRAYEFYEARGSSDGQDVADWLRAESELTGIKEQVVESEDEVRIQVPLDELSGADLQVGVDRQHVIVTARTGQGPEPGRSTPAGSIRAAKRIELPVEVDPARSSATSDGRTLSLVLPKTSKS